MNLLFDVGMYCRGAVDDYNQIEKSWELGAGSREVETRDTGEVRRREESSGAEERGAGRRGVRLIKAAGKHL